ncbi:DUF4012 domain-containing protein [Mycolicibacterium fluoranthenivorans]|jgi:hypothetical protein|uniref:DUF4012 domain-containing protein n=1 Tax=Mycolicibacterium fluoranthenivorans TaxID=258505 RepID=A0A1G4WWC0_9MYCO|nr:DUF4012 domain-containing protein [Mycolicibacterium fluoranthenivorans]SCX30413.1 Protein of unknown function [Mycolicibacterium fluoranthenivorans]
MIAWLGYEAYLAKGELERARSNAQEAKDALSDGRAEDAQVHAKKAQAQALAANEATHSVPWRIAAIVPWLGSPFETAQQISHVVLGLVSDVLQPSAQIGAGLSPDQLFEGSRLNVQLLRDKEPALSKISADARRLNAEADAISDPTYLSVLRKARTAVQDQTARVTSLLENTTLAARLAPSMMGADGPRSYFMGFQTNAEARGTGGILGGFGILHFDNGTPTVEALGPNTELKGPFAPLDLGPEYAEQYGFANPSTDFRNSNLSSHFPYTAQIWKSMWAQTSGASVDGAIAIDPVALSYILGAVGPVTLADGEKITKDNVVELTESIAYQRFPTDQTARKQYLQDIANAVVKKMTGKLESPRHVLDALGKAVGEGRIALWSASPENQELLEETPLAHVVPADSAPYAEVVINNLGGNKMDYYLRREIEYAGDGCSEDQRNTTVTVKLKSVVPEGPLPDYVAGAAGVLPNLPFTMPSGSMLTSVRLIGTKDAKLLSAFSNGERVPVFTGTERGHPTFEIQVAIPPRQAGELVFRLSEPTAPGAPRVPIQPLIDNVKPKVDVPRCSG